MFEESASAIPSSVWASMNSWFTPTLLFLLLNLMIATIAFTSTQKQHHHNQPKIARSTSVLHRLKSINFYSLYRSQDPQNFPVHHNQNQDLATHSNLETQSHYFFQENNLETSQSSEAPYLFDVSPQITQTQFISEQKDSNSDDFQPAIEEEDSLPSMDEVYSKLTGGHCSRTKSDTEPASGEVPAKLPARMRKSASLKSEFGHFAEEDIVEARRPATVRERGNARVTEGDEEVDAKADDFINKFRQQLKLQKLDSLIKYRNIIGRAIK